MAITPITTAVIIPQGTTTPEEAAVAVMAVEAEALWEAVQEADEEDVVDKIFGGGFLLKALTKHLMLTGCFNRRIVVIYSSIPSLSHYNCLTEENLRI